MQTEHPLWETTHEDVNVPVRVVSGQQKQVTNVKRSPAALFGISIIVLTGFTIFGGMNIFSAQVTENEIKATITDDGIQPTEIVTKAGQTIHWLNSGSIPHILESSTLKDEKGETMETIAIFPGSEVSYDIPLSALDGSYDYESRTSKKINGRIIIQNSATSTTSATTPTPSVPAIPTPTPTAPVIPTPVIPTPAVSSTTVSSSLSSSIPSAMPDKNIEPTAITKNPDILPYNPNTVESTTKAAITKNVSTTEIATHRPTKQPESGASAWIIAFCGVVALYGVMKKASI